MAETIGDLDLLVASDDAAGVMEAFTKVGMTERVLARGETKSSILTRKGVQVDRVVPLEAWGAAMIYFTGSKAHNIRIREMAVRKAQAQRVRLVPREVGQAHRRGETEEEVYEKPLAPVDPPTLREDRGEVEAALEGTLPDVLVRTQLRGDLHTHTNLTDGLASLEQMLAAASELRYAYYAVTDHAPNLFMQRMTDEKMPRAAGEAHLQSSPEDDPAARHRAQHRRRGQRGLGRDFLEGFDVCVASVHALQPEKDEMTRRIVRWRTPVHVIGHPTGRIINNASRSRWTSKRYSRPRRARGRPSRSTATPTGSICGTSTSCGRGATA